MIWPRLIAPIQVDAYQVHARAAERNIALQVARGPYVSSRMYVARLIIEAGIVRLSAFAVWRFAPSSKSLGLPIGRSPGLAPFRMRSTKEALRRNSIDRSGP